MTKVRYCALLSVTDGRLVAKDGMAGVYEAFDAVAGPDVTTIALIYLRDKVRAELLRQYPELGSPVIGGRIADICKTDLANLHARMDADVLPLLSREYYEVKHLDDTEELEEGYAPFLDKLFKEKQNG